MPDDTQGVTDLADERDDVHSDGGEENDSPSMRSKRGEFTSVTNSNRWPVLPNGHF